MRILDVGCGKGNPPPGAPVLPSDTVIGVDLRIEALRTARQHYPHRNFLCCRAENLPFSNTSFDRVVSNVALPYMDIPAALAEIGRVLKPEGTLFATLHNPRFTLKELVRAFPRPVPTVFRLYVLANGFILHCTGRTLKFPTGRCESCQTERGMTKALERAGFRNVIFSRPEGRMIAEAEK